MIQVQKEIHPSVYINDEGIFHIISREGNVIKEVKLQVKGNSLINEFLLKKKNEIFDYYRKNIVL